MVNTSKILTVSYGTFSCTLEGFDDSFDTMKAIAEYFRDLAADDRYFGAEPPIPDTEMLARIAEREISRHVTAVEDQGNIVLRATTTEIEPEIAPEIIPEIATAAVVVAAPEETIAVEAPVSESAAEANPEEISPEVAPQAAPSEIDAFADFAEVPAPAVDSESVAAKLRRIRAVVSKADDQTADDSYNEDEHAVDFLSDAPTSFEIEDSKEEAPEESVAEFVEQIADIADQVETAPEDILDAVTADVLEDAYEDETVEDQSDDEGQISEFLERLSRDADAAEVDADPETATKTTEIEDAEIEETETAEPIAETSVAAVAKVIEARAEDGEAVQPQRPRVLKIKRADFEAAVARGQHAEDSEQHSLKPDTDPEVDPSTLSHEDETDLINELAMVEAEFEDDLLDDDFEQAMEQPAEQPTVDIEDDIAAYMEDEFAPETAPESRSNLTESNEQDLSRILAETNTQMDEPESKTRRSAIQHLRAAVAATYAEKAAGNDTTLKPDTSGAYRDDLASVVRPRRPAAQDVPETQRARRPAGPGVAPLKLVAEQRVDTDELPTHAPIRPRRISLAELAAQSEAATSAPDETVLIDAGSFSDFAEAMGATKLPDLLEAAAAYLSFVEGREKFSRPQLMTKVRQVEQDDFSREDGLRSFGQLLRQGKIQKLKGGRFTVSERINYKPDERYAG